MTTIVEQDSAALCERQRILKDEIMPGILNMKRYLGKVNFGDQFQRREKKGLVNWEFDDKETKTTFKPTLLGEIASATYGTLLKGRGNFKPPKDSPVNPSFISPLYCVNVVVVDRPVTRRHQSKEHHRPSKNNRIVHLNGTSIFKPDCSPQQN